MSRHKSTETYSWIPADDTRLIDEKCLENTPRCRELRRQMSIPELQRAYAAELAGKRRERVMRLLIGQEFRLRRIEEKAVLAKVKPKPRHPKPRASSNVRAEWL